MKRIIAALLACAVVFGLWRWTDPFDRSTEAQENVTISVFGPWLSSDADAFADSVGGFVDDTGIEVRYTGSGNFSSDLRDRLASGSESPDLAVVPQPGLVRGLIDNGLLVPLGPETREAVDANLAGAPTDVGGGSAFVLPYRTIVKSLVWYRPEVFEENGWTIPTSLDELHVLVDEIQASTPIAPWCFGVFSGADTGWPATDWVEDLLLRRAGGVVYDEWVAGNRGFENAAVRAAFDEFADLVLEQGRVAGGPDRMLGAELREVDDPLFATEPGCAMYKQASFGTIWFPAGTEIGPEGDVDFFVLPGVDPDEPAPLLRSGDVIVQLSDRAEVDELMAYLASPAGAADWAARGGYVSSRSSVDIDTYYQDDDRRVAALLLEDRPSRFDGSDQMPSGFRDLLLDDITSWVAGALGYDAMATNLDAARNP